MTITEHKHFDGGCAKATDSNPEPVEGPWKIQKSIKTVHCSLGKDGELEGSDKDDFGGIIAWGCCYKGYYAGFGAEGVSKATTQAVVLSSVLILACDYVMTSFLF